MPTINTTEYNLDVTHIRSDPMYAQNTSEIATVVVTNTPSMVTSFEIQTNSHGILLMVNTPSITYIGCVYLLPNSLYTFVLCRSQTPGIWQLSAQTPFDLSWSPTLAWISAVGAQLTTPPPLTAHILAVMALSAYQSIVHSPTLYDRAVANEALNAAVSNLVPTFDRTALYSSFPQLADATAVTVYVTSLLNNDKVRLPNNATNPVYIGPSDPDQCTGKYKWNNPNPVLPNWSYTPYMANTYTTVPPREQYPQNTMDVDAQQLIQITNSRTVAQGQIAVYYLPSPPAHIAQIVMSLLSQNYKSEIDNAQIMSLVTMALNDAGVYAWTLKYKFWGARPNTFINNFQSYIGTPNFPGYISGHSTFSAAAAQMVSLILPQYGKILQHIARNSGISRLYGGVHFSADNNIGLSSGAIIGTTIFNNLLTQIKTHQAFIQ